MTIAQEDMHVNMDKLAWCALGFVAASTIACLVVHRRVVAALVKGEPMPEPPASHKGWHPRLK